jgi:hypothetical protein
MPSKQLESILSGLPSATVTTTATARKEPLTSPPKRRVAKLVAVVPEGVKEELRARALREGKTEKTLLLEALKAYGFRIDERQLLDQRTLR